MCASVLDAMLYSDSDCSDFLGKGTRSCEGDVSTRWNLEYVIRTVSGADAAEWRRDRAPEVTEGKGQRRWLAAGTSVRVLRRGYSRREEARGGWIGAVVSPWVRLTWRQVSFVLRFCTFPSWHRHRPPTVHYQTPFFALR